MSRWLKLFVMPAFAITLGLTALGQDAKPKTDDKPKAEDKKAEDKKTEDKKPADKKDEKKPAEKKPTVLKVTVPTETAELTIEKQIMKTTGKSREFDVPPLKADDTYEYEFVVKFEPNNYTTITRKKTVTFKGSDAVVTVDLTKDDPTDRAFVRFVPTPDDIVKEMVKLAGVGKDDVVFELGCGDARILIGAIKEGGAKKGVGIDLDPERVKDSKANVEKNKVGDKVEIRQGDVLDVKDLSDATVVMLYMSDELGKLLEPVLKKALKPGARVVSHRFTLGEWKPEKTNKVTGQDGDEYTLHLWTVPKK